jgi:hypothetical protein
MSNPVRHVQRSRSPWLSRFPYPLPDMSDITIRIGNGAIKEPPHPQVLDGHSKHFKKHSPSDLELLSSSPRLTLPFLRIWEKIGALLSIPLSFQRLAQCSSSPTMLIVFVTLGDSSSRWLGLLEDSQACGWAPKSLHCLPRERILSEGPSLTLVATCKGFGVESNPTLCGLLNGDVDTFVVLNFGRKILCLLFSYWFTF